MSFATLLLSPIGHAYSATLSALCQAATFGQRRFALTTIDELSH